jgi:hypothetical protein
MSLNPTHLPPNTFLKKKNKERTCKKPLAPSQKKKNNNEDLGKN